MADSSEDARLARGLRGEFETLSRFLLVERVELTGVAVRCNDLDAAQHEPFDEPLVRLGVHIPGRGEGVTGIATTPASRCRCFSNATSRSDLIYDVSTIGA